MVGVTTIALLERKTGMSRDLFSRYWRDVHGVMAARIPGFESYTQHHVTPVSNAREPFEGIAIVTFASEADRQGLATSEMTTHIHRDEQNVFRRALLYNLAAGADSVVINGNRRGIAMFFVVPVGSDAASLGTEIEASQPTYLARYDLTTGDPAGWNETDVDDGGRGRRFAALYHGIWTDGSPECRADLATYRCDETHVMVERGSPTAVGLRGLDALRTIIEAGANNQLRPDVERALFNVRI